MSDLQEIRTDFEFWENQTEEELEGTTLDLNHWLPHIRTLLAEVDRLKKLIGLHPHMDYISRLKHLEIVGSLQAENAKLTTALKKIEELPRSMVSDSYTAMVDMARIAREALKGG